MGLGQKLVQPNEPDAQSAAAANDAASAPATSQPGTTPFNPAPPSPPIHPGGGVFPFGLAPQPGQQQIPQPALQFMIQSGLAGGQQNPDAIRHMTEFLSHDSDNKLTLLSATAKRNHTLRMTILIFMIMIAFVLLSIPFISIITTGNISQAVGLIGQGATWIVPILLALVAGPSIKDLLSK